MTKRIFLFSLLSLYFFFAKNIFAKDFSSFYKVTYEFKNGGEALVTQEISLVNQSANLYVSEYSLSLVGGEITDIEAYDKIGPLKTKIDHKGETTIITLTFNEKVVGKDKILSFLLRYKDLSLAQKEGNLWQISIPKLANSKEVDEFNVILKVPLEFGKLSVINPTPQETTTRNSFYEITFNKDDLVNFGVLASFGQYQTYSFKINYLLENTEDSVILEKVAIPPDTNYQTVFYDYISPLPVNVTTDEDGNWLADFEIPPQGKITVEIAGQVDVFSQPKNIEISRFPPKIYLSSTKYWNASDPEIINLGQKLKTPEEIYKFVTSTLAYDYQKVKEGFSQRIGAKEALENPKKSTCTEFTDLFIAIARSAGIPAREVVGYAQTDNSFLKQISTEVDLLHSWPEYFDSKKGKWIAIDPTWGNTTGGVDFFNKFDMAHFAFIIHGKNDTLPLPPGSTREEKTKKIFVSYSEGKTKNQQRAFSVEGFYPSTVYSWINNQVILVIRNNSGFALYNERVQNLTLQQTNPSEWFIEKILPFSQFKIQFGFKPKEKFKDYRQELVFTFGENNVRYNIKVTSLSLRLVIVLGCIFSITILLLILSIKKRKNYEKTF